MAPNRRSRPHGSALLTVMCLLAVLAILSVTMLQLSQNQVANAANTSRSFPRNYCVDTGMQLARSFFGNHFNCWNSNGALCTAPNVPSGGFLGNPSAYSPVAVPTYGGALAVPWPDAGLSLTHPELFADLDGDGNYDVFIYIRDNQDELPSQSNPNPTVRWLADSDGQAYVGAICVSQTLVPRFQNGQVDSTGVQEEALLHYNN